MYCSCHSQADCVPISVGRLTSVRILVTADPGFTVPPLLYGGIERVIASLAEKLRKYGHIVGLVAEQGSSCRVEELFAWPELTATRTHHTRFMRKIAGAVRTFEPDVVHSFSRLLYLGSLLLDRSLPKIMSFQREPTRRTLRWADRLARGSLSFTGCSDYISSRGRHAGGDWHTVHNFVDLERYTFQPTVASDAPLVFLSRIEPIKGTHLAIDACSRAGRKLIIAGNHSEKDDEEGRYWREVVTPQINGREIVYVGTVDDVQKNQLLGKAAALIVPVQWEEPFGIVFAEALACGTPVISCARGALPEIVENGRHGFLVHRAEYLNNAIGKLGGVDRAVCRQRAETCFSAEVVVRRYEQLYSELVAGDSLQCAAF